MVTIANPIYDTVFKFLMEDDKSAKILLGALLEVEILELEMRQNEYSLKVRKDLEILRIDFCAKVKDNEGNIRVVTIELQKAKMESDVIRFRKYLAAQYRNRSNVIKEEGHKKAIPIVSIFIMGYPCCNVEEPVIYGIPEFYNVENHKISDIKSDFVFGLIHRMIVVQVPFLRTKIKTKVERILSVFDQKYKIDKTVRNSHALKVPSKTDDWQYNYIVRQLVKANVDEKIQDEMDVEDDIYDEIEMWENLLDTKTQQLSEAAKQLDDKTKQLDDKTKQLDETAKQLSETAKQLSEANKHISEKNRKMAIKLFESGDSVEDIADFLGIDVSVVERYVS